MTETINVQAVLNCPLPPNNDAGVENIRGYLVALLAKLWHEQDEFSGKRPFGNSDWSYDLYAALLSAGIVDGSIDSDGYIDEVDEQAADELIRAAIRALGETR